MPTTVADYLGLKLASPVILSSSNLTNTTNGIRRAAEAGAGAVVLKSLFEEQIDADSASSSEDVDLSTHPEAEEYVRQMSKHLGPESYLDLIREARDSVAIPIIASVNCISPRWWGDYARQIEIAGASALELNIALMPRGASDPRGIEREYVAIVERVHAQVDVPIAVKIGPYFTNVATMVQALASAGAQAVVLFNRFYQFDIDVEKLALAPGYRFSAPEEVHSTLRWISILAGTTCQIAGSTAIATGADVVKMILAGANAVQVCSAVYQNGYERITEMNNDLVAWMQKHGFDSLDAFRGRLSQAASATPQAYERLQYIKALTGVS